ncbi:cyclic nucleotide-binding/CBS domain-containing protein [Nanoarchaeota archaeon]
MEAILVADVMTRSPVTINPDTNLLECARKMVRKRVGSLLITDKKKLVGFVSRRDILWALIKKSKKGLKEIKAIEISPKKIATTKPDSTIKETLSKMKKFKFDKLPVIKEKELVGIVTAKDILNFNPELYPELEEFAKIKEETKKLKRVKKAKDRRSIYEGICEECGAQDYLYRVNGMLICESCRGSM